MRLALCAAVIVLVVLSGCTSAPSTTVSEVNETANKTITLEKSTLTDKTKVTVTVVDINLEIQAFASFLKEVNELLS
jgi:hypothetical protein